MFIFISRSSKWDSIFIVHWNLFIQICWTLLRVLVFTKYVKYGNVVFFTFKVSRLHCSWQNRPGSLWWWRKKDFFFVQEFLAYGKSNDGPGTPDFSSQLKVSENRENISPIRFVFQTWITAKVVGHHEEQALRVLGFLSSQFLK
jgi:hypothetical protein